MKKSLGKQKQPVVSTNAAGALLITDLRCALPAEAWTDADADADATVTAPEAGPPSAGNWQVLPYRSRLYEGYMLRTVHADAATLRIPLGRSGWHAVSLVIGHASGGDSYVEARLTGEERWLLVADAYCSYGPEESLGTRSRLHEEPWRLADLTGRDLEIRFPQGWGRGRNVGGHGALYAVRVVPLSADEVPVAASCRHQPLVLFASDRPPFFSARFAADEWDAVCFNNVVLGGVKAFSYPSTIMVQSPKDAWMLPPQLQAWQNHTGDDPLQQGIDTAHGSGKRFWMTIRPQSWVHAIPCFDQLIRAPFFVVHPEYRCLEADGTPLSTLSVAFPAVREYLGAVFAETLDRGADGITILFNRGFALARYEDPVRERFRELYGVEARELPDSDPRLHRVWAEFITAWIRELRAMLDAKGPTPLVKRRELTVMVGPCLEWNLAYGIDVEAWAKAGLVDVVMPYPRHTHTDRFGDTYIKQPDGWIDIAAYVRVLKGTAVQLLPSLGDYMHPESLAVLRQRAHDYYQAGADGICRWDNEECMPGARLDDPEVQRIWQNYWPPQDNPLIEIGGLRVDVFSPTTGFV